LVSFYAELKISLSFILNFPVCGSFLEVIKNVLHAVFNAVLQLVERQGTFDEFFLTASLQIRNSIPDLQEVS